MTLGHMEENDRQAPWSISCPPPPPLPPRLCARSTGHHTFVGVPNGQSLLLHITPATRAIDLGQMNILTEL